jgi:hypothetical protein
MDWGLVPTEANATTLPFNSAAGSVVVPFGDMHANYSNGSSNYSGFTADLRKRFTNHYEFVASYSYSHAIDDSTDLQSPLAPPGQLPPSAGALQLLRAPPLRIQRCLPVR